MVPWILATVILSAAVTLQRCVPLSGIASMIPQRAHSLTCWCWPLAGLGGPRLRLAPSSTCPSSLVLPWVFSPSCGIGIAYVLAALRRALGTWMISYLWVQISELATGVSPRALGLTVSRLGSHAPGALHGGSSWPRFCGGPSPGTSEEGFPAPAPLAPRDVSPTLPPPRPIAPARVRASPRLTQQQRPPHAHAALYPRLRPLHTPPRSSPAFSWVLRGPTDCKEPPAPLPTQDHEPLPASTSHFHRLGHQFGRSPRAPRCRPSLSPSLTLSILPECPLSLPCSLHCGAQASPPLLALLLLGGGGPPALRCQRCPPDSPARPLP